MNFLAGFLVGSVATGFVFAEWTLIKAWLTKEATTVETQVVAKVNQVVPTVEKAVTDKATQVEKTIVSTVKPAS